MIALDTNILIYAHRSATAEHRASQRAIELASGALDGWGIAVASLAEFYAIVTHPASSGRPSTPQEAAAFVRVLREQGGMKLWGPGPAFGPRLLQTAEDLAVTGVRIFDLQIALCALEAGATELWTHDGGFVRLPGLRLHDPLG